MINTTAKINDFIARNREGRVETIALQLRDFSTEEGRFILQQIEGWQKLRHKVPSWTSTEGLWFPPRISLEQCSSEFTASQKGQIVAQLLTKKHENNFIDLTGGLGVDFSMIAPLFAHSTYIEMNENLCELAHHNFPLLGLSSDIRQGDGVAYIETLEDNDDTFLFLDPARRDTAGRKTVLLEDCTPNVIDILPLLRKKASRVMLKLSPMLDVTATLKQLKEVTEVYIIAHKGEVKDIVLVLDFKKGETAVYHDETVLFSCIEDNFRFSFTPQEEANVLPSFASHEDIAEGAYLYEPCAAIMKAGAFRLMATHFDLRKLHTNSHLYVSHTLFSNFPGRIFTICDVTSFNKKDLKDFLKRQPTQANLTIRNFPATTADLRKRLKIKDGGNFFWFATTIEDNSHIIIATQKATLQPSHND